MTQVCAQPAPASSRTDLFPAGTVATLHSRDFDEVASLPPLWEQQYSQIERGQYEGGAFMAMTAGLMVAMERSSVGLMIRGSIPPRSALVAIPYSRRGLCTYRGERVTDRGAIVVFSGEELDFRTTGPFDVFTFVAERELLERHAQSIFGRSLDSLRRNAQTALEDPAGMQRRVRAMIADLSARGNALGEDLLDPASAAAFERDKCEEILSGLAPRQFQPPVMGRAELAWTVERYLRSNLELDLSIPDLCRITGAPERTLHLAFKEHVGSSPKAYQKALLLNAARADLRSTRAGMTVTRVAARWGFGHLGWFAHDYRAMFGESPHETLRHRTRSVRAPGPRPVAVFG